MKIPSSEQSLSLLQGAKIVRAQSSLTCFGMVFADGRGLLLEALDEDEGELKLKYQVVDASQVPPLAEAVCSVNWTWIYGSELDELKVFESSIKFKLMPAGPLTVTTQSWQGRPFLSFMPYKG